MSAPPGGVALHDISDLIAIARIARPQGLRGEVIADILTDFPDRFAGLSEVHLRRPGGGATRIGLESSRLHKARVVLKFRGIDRIEQAEPLRGQSVEIERGQLRPLPPDTWYNFDLIGCEVVRQAGENSLEAEAGDDPLPGRVVGVEEYGAAPLLVVAGRDGRELMIPLARSICVEVDVQRRLIVVDPPEGLFD